jgi:hypothetical protein
MLNVRITHTLCGITLLVSLGMAGACSSDTGSASCTPMCAESECGDDGCGGLCGTCPQVAPYCVLNQCAVTCAPSCPGRQCGDDGCGGSCGECITVGTVCAEDGLCVDPLQGAPTPATQGPTKPITVRLFLPTASADPMTGVGRLVLRFQFEDGSEEVVSTQLYAFGQLDYDADLPIGMQSAPVRMVVEGWSVRTDGQFGYLLSVGRYPLTPGLVAGSVLRVKMGRINHISPLSSLSDDAPQALMTARLGHTVTHTADGVTLIVGGSAQVASDLAWWTSAIGASSVDAVASIDPSTWSLAVSSPLGLSRAWHTATEVTGGDVFVAGGWGPDDQSGALCAVGGGAANGALCAVEWYAPGDGFQLLQQPLGKARAGHTATSVDDTPTVLFVGGDTDGEGTWELWDPVQGSLGPQPFPDETPRRFHAAVAAPVYDDNGVEQDAVVIFGGESDTQPLASGLFYVVESALMLPHPEPLPKGARTQLTGTYVPAQGYIYFVAGYTAVDRGAATTAVDVYDARAAAWQEPFVPGLETFNLNAARGGHSASRVEETRIVVLGGSDGTQALDRTEVIYEYAANDGTPAVIDVASSCHTEGCVARVAPMTSKRLGHRAVVDQWGDVLLVGGRAALDGGSMVHELMLFTPQ